MIILYHCMNHAKDLGEANLLPAMVTAANFSSGRSQTPLTYDDSGRALPIMAAGLYLITKEYPKIERFMQERIAVNGQ